MEKNPIENVPIPEEGKSEQEKKNLCSELGCPQQNQIRKLVR